VLAAVPPFSQLLADGGVEAARYLADASSVEFTRNPRALLRALEHIAKTESPLKQGTAGTGHLFIVNPREVCAKTTRDFREPVFDASAAGEAYRRGCRRCWGRCRHLRLTHRRGLTRKSKLRR